MRARRSVFFAIFLTGLVPTATPEDAPAEKTLSFFHTHTGKRLEVTFSRGGRYVEAGLAEVDRSLADSRTGDVRPIDPQLLDLIYDIRAKLGSTGTFEVISAYRSPKTNEMLLGRSGGVASRSQHLLGKAIDVRLGDTDTAKLHRAAIEMQRGGVGYYLKSDFVHIDTGRVRRW